VNDDDSHVKIWLYCSSLQISKKLKVCQSENKLHLYFM